MMIPIILLPFLVPRFNEAYSQKDYHSEEYCSARACGNTSVKCIINGLPDQELEFCLHGPGQNIPRIITIPPLKKPAKGLKAPNGTSIPQNCLMVPRNIFTQRLRVDQLDGYLHRTKSTVLDFYGWYTNEFERIMNVKNRHILIIKVLVEHLNRSLSSCGSLQFRKDRKQDREIDFATITTIEKLYNYQSSDLFHSREQCEVGFAAVKQKDNFLILISLVKPIGWRIFKASGMLIPFLTVCIFLYHKMSDKFARQFMRKKNRPDIIKLSGFLIRAHMDQCVENRQTASIVGTTLNIRFLYMSWLFYCLLVTTTFKSNLIQELMKPAATVSPETFEELLADPRPFVGFDGGKGGQSCEIPKVLASEAITHADVGGWEKGVFSQLMRRYKKRGIHGVEDLLDGRLNIFEETDILHTMFQILERKYGIQHYKIGSAVRANDIFWAVKRTQHSARILETLGFLASSGIVDYFRIQQKMMDKVWSDKVLQAFFSGFFEEERRARRKEEEEYDTEDDDTGEKRLQKCLEVFNSMKERIRSLGLEFSKGAEPITLYNYLALWILLGVGFSTAGFVFLGESITNIRRLRFDLIDKFISIRQPRYYICKPFKLNCMSVFCSIRGLMLMQRLRSIKPFCKTIMPTKQANTNP